MSTDRFSWMTEVSPQKKSRPKRTSKPAHPPKPTQETIGPCGAALLKKWGFEPAITGHDERDIPPQAEALDHPDRICD